MLQVTISRRSAFLIVLALLLLIPAAAYAGHVFNDVGDTDTHIDGITFMKDSGVSVGCDANNNYCPDDNVTRAQMATFMYRLSGNDPATPPSVIAKSAESAARADSAVVATNPIAVAGGSFGGSVSTSDWTEVGSVEITIPAEATSATVVGTFSAETTCSGGSGLLIGPWCAARMLIDGAEMSPSHGTGLALDSSDSANEGIFSWESHSFQRYSEGLAPGTYTVSVEVSSQGSTPPTFTVGDWTLVVTAHPTS